MSAEAQAAGDFPGLPSAGWTRLRVCMAYMTVSRQCDAWLVVGSMFATAYAYGCNLGLRGSVGATRLSRYHTSGIALINTMSTA